MSAPETGDPLARLVAIMARLRDPDSGCPWDRTQTWDTIVPHTLEEAYEVADAIERRAFDEIRDELGDLLFQVVYYARFAAEEGRFDLYDVIDALADKMIRRHPHVFGDDVVEDTAELKLRWDAAKAAEREAKPGAAPSELDDVPVALPATSRAAKIQRRAARVGFDFSSVSDAFTKLTSEIAELDEVLGSDATDALEHELGDVLFATINVARHAGVDAESALRRATARFESRFRHVEDQVVSSGRRMDETDAVELDRLWEAAKRAEHKG